MGGHRNYYLILETLVIFKELITKSDPIAEYIKGLKHSGDIDESGIPSNKEIAQTLGLKQTKVNERLRKLYKDLLWESRFNPPVIKNLIHQIHIGYTIEEIEKYKNKEIRKEIEDRTLDISLRLPETPRLGEYINLSFLEGSQMRSGYVHKIYHEIHGVNHTVYIYAHPTRRLCSEGVK